MYEPPGNPDYCLACSRRFSMLSLLLLVALYAPVGWAQSEDADPVPDTEEVASEIIENPALDIAKGCAAGALAGSVVPGLGNLIGCAVGGLGEWLFDVF